MIDRPPSPTRALLDARALVALSAAAVTAWATGWWWLLLPGILLYLWLARAAAMEMHDPFAWEQPDLRTLTQRHRRRAEAAADILRRLNEEVRTAPPFLGDSMRPIWAEVRAL